MCNSFRLSAKRFYMHHSKDGICYINCSELAGTRNSSMGPTVVDRSAVAASAKQTTKRVTVNIQLIWSVEEGK